MTDLNRELDLDIVSASWRSMSDQDAYDQMLAAWERKLEAVAMQPRLPLVDGALRKQLGSIEELLEDRRNIQIRDPLEKVVSETPAPAMILSSGGVVEYLNNGAQGFFGVSHGMPAGTAWIRADSLADYKAVREAILGHTNTDYAIIRLTGLGKDGTFAEVYRLTLDALDADYIVVRSLQLDWDSSVSEALQKAFGLTSAETEVCELLFAHLDLSVVAKKRLVTLETVRTQVKRILNKTEAHSKTELVRLLGLLCASAAAKREKLDLTWSDPLMHEEILVRRDGRKLGYTWTGDKNGKPILFVPDQMSCNYFPERFRSELAVRGIKLFLLSLPGFGNSDSPTSKNQLDDGCEAIDEFCKEMRFGPISVFAFRSAQPYIFRLSIAKPTLFRFILCLGLPWNITPKRQAGLDPLDATMLKLAKDAPLAYDIICRIGYRMMQTHGPDFYWSKLYSRNQADMDTVANGDVRPLLRASVRHVAAQGFSAFKRSQLVLVESPISTWVREIPIPFHWMIPELSVEMDISDFLEVQSLNPSSTIEVVPDTGDLLPFQSEELFLQRVLCLADKSPASAIASQIKPM